MFFPLLEAIDKGKDVNPDGMGKLGLLIKGIEWLGVPLTLVGILIVMVIFFTLKGIASYGSALYDVFLRQAFIRKIRLNLVDQLNLFNFKNFISSDVGRIQNTMTGEVSRISTAFRDYFNTFKQVVMMLVYTVFAFLANPQFAILVTVGGIITNFLYKIIYERTKGASRKLTRYNSRFQGQIIQHVAHFKYLKATGKVNDFGAKLKKTIYKVEESQRKIGVLSAIGSSAREPLLVIVIALVIYIQTSYFGGTMGQIILSLLFFYRALTALVMLQQTWNNFLSYSGSMENMQNFEKLLKQGKEKDGDKKPQPLQHSIQLKNVGFWYDQALILKNINLTLYKNQSTAFVGESGSGKTTLVNIISGLLEESEGQVLIDETPLKELKKQYYQNHIGYVSQDPVIFNDTLYNNVSFWAPETPENIARFEKCVQQASLEEFLKELPKGKNTKLGNNGINLSGGQKQRVSIARELFKEVEILILDEATSALDSETESAIQSSIDALQGQYTILLIAHRLSTIRNADQIVFMDKGRVIDVDTFEGLVNKQDRFRQMVELQEL